MIVMRKKLIRKPNQEIEVDDNKISDTVLKRKCNNLIDTLNTVMNQSIDRFDSHFKEVKFNIDIYDDTDYFFEKYIDGCYDCLVNSPLSMKHILSLFKVKKEDDAVNQIKHCFIDEIERQINIMDNVYCNNHSIATFFNTMYLVNPNVFIQVFNDYEFGLGTQRILQEYICKLDCDTYFSDVILDKLGIMCYDYKYIRKEDITLYDGSVELLDFSQYE